MSILQVWLGDRPVGQLWRDRHGCLFRFDLDYLEASDGFRPVLGQWFEDRLQRGKAFRKKTLHAWFQNVIPEPKGALRERICRQLGLADDDDVALLASLGERLPGAVRVTPLTDEPAPGDVVHIPESALPPALRTSLGGIQLKFTLSGTPNRLSLPVSSGDDRWILKIAGGEYPGLAENEAATMRWCAAAGFDVPEVVVVPREALPDGLGALPDTPTALLVRRFDRVAGRRVHQEDFAQVCSASPEAKYAAAAYQDVARLTRAILGSPGVLELVRRLVVVIATGNADAHLKNWSLLYPDGVRAAWTPLYDQVATVAYPQVAPELALRLGNVKHFRRVDREPLRWVAAQGGLAAAAADAAIDAVIEALRACFDPEAFGLPPLHAEALRAHWREVPLLRAFGLSR